jgi:O-antigen/teichoic acid export membrane protein
MLALTVPFCLIGVAAAIPVGHLIGHGRPAVTRFVELGLWLSPLSVTFQTMGLVAVAEQRWGLINRLRLTPPLTTAVCFVVLYALGRLTLTSAALVIIVTGLLSGAQLVPLLLRTRGWALRSSLIRPSLRFGARSWVATVLANGNSYADQLMMTGLTSARQLGLYAVATTVSSVALPVIVAPLVAGSFADVAKGHYESIAAISRTAMLATFACAVALAGVGPLAIALLFGRAFDGATVMVLLLLLSSLSASVGGVLTALLSAAGRPADGLRAQAVGLLLSVPLLALVLPRFGGVGASVVDNITNASVAIVALRYGTRVFGGRAADYWLPRRADAHTLYMRTRAGLRDVVAKTLPG